MSRKTEQEIIVDGQIRFWEDKQRKARTIGNQLKIAAVLKQLRAERWPSPTDEAIAQSKVEKLKIKAAKLTPVKAETPKVESEWLARPNPVEEQAKRAEYRNQQREERAKATTPIEPVTVIPDGGDSAGAMEAVAAPPASDGVTVFPDMQDITRAAEAAAVRHSTKTAASTPSASIHKAWDHPVAVDDPFTEYQGKAAMEDRLRERHREQHPVRRDVRDEGRLIDSYTGRPVNRGE